MLRTDTEWVRLLILGGTAWLGRTVAAAAHAAGDEVVCLARGESGAVPSGVTLVRSDRNRPDAYEAVAAESWDAVLDVSRTPRHVEGAVEALGNRTEHWIFVSTGNVYADQVTLGGDETAALLDPLPAGEPPTPESYGPAKVACERSVLTELGADRALIARSGLIGGPEDEFDRSGYWPWRFARPASADGGVLVPDVPQLTTSMIDVRDLAAFLLLAARERVAGCVDAVGELMSFRRHLEAAREVAGHGGALVPASPAWLEAQGVQPWMGARSLPLWLPPDFVGLTARPGAKARSAGLVSRPIEETLADTLAWELSRTQPVPRRAGLSDDDERRLHGLAHDGAGSRTSSRTRDPGTPGSARPTAASDTARRR